MKLDYIINCINESSDVWDTLTQLLPEKKFQFTEELLKAITDALEQQDKYLLEDLLVIPHFDGVDRRYTDVFLKILTSDWYWLQEDVALLLEEIADPSTTDALYTTALNIPDHDDGRSLAKKCMWALKAVATPEAFEKLRQLSKHPDPIIRENALLQL